MHSRQGARMNIDDSNIYNVSTQSSNPTLLSFLNALQWIFIFSLTNHVEESQGEIPSHDHILTAEATIFLGINEDWLKFTCQPYLSKRTKECIAKELNSTQLEHKVEKLKRCIKHTKRTNPNVFVEDLTFQTSITS